MGLLEDLDYQVKPANAAQRVTQALAASGPGSWVFQRTLYPIDKALFKMTNGKVTVPGLLAGLPVIMLTTTGAKSGKQRTMPLLGIPMDGEIAVIGSNYGQESTPGWVHNLRKNPEATVSYRSKTAPALARLGTAAETDRAFELGAAFYGGYPKYRERADHRKIESFILIGAKQ